jgi:hypothetical protein
VGIQDSFLLVDALTAEWDAIREVRVLKLHLRAGFARLGRGVTAAGTRVS